MNLEYIQLPDFLIADLYKSNLVIVNDEPKTEKIPAKPRIDQVKEWYLGSNLRKITIIVREKEAVYLQDEALQFLSSILGACKLNLGDVAIVNYENESATYAHLKEKLNPEFILLFNVTAKEIQIPFTVPHYQVQSHDHCQFLLAPDLQTMLGSSQQAKLEKSKLWLSLKKMFSI
jgi:hypothetical protein